MKTMAPPARRTAPPGHESTTAPGNRGHRSTSIYRAIYGTSRASGEHAVRFSASRQPGARPRGAGRTDPKCTQHLMGLLS